MHGVAVCVVCVACMVRLGWLICMVRLVWLLCLVCLLCLAWLVCGPCGLCEIRHRRERGIHLARQALVQATEEHRASIYDAPTRARVNGPNDVHVCSQRTKSKIER